MTEVLASTSSISFRASLKAHICVFAAMRVQNVKPSTVRWLLTAVRGGARASTYSEVLSCREAIVSVSRKCAGEFCLPRSIATTLMCRWNGHWPTWVTGAKLEPFQAHAWVMAEGRPVGEAIDVSDYAPLMSIEPKR